MAFQQALSGLAASSKAIDVTSNNIANASTVGFKAGNALFQDVFASALTGASSTGQVGIGSASNVVRQQFTQGGLTTTGNPLDMAINGNGFFIVQRNDGSLAYSRNGQFEADADGFIVTPLGERLQGIQAVNGVINPNGALQPLIIPSEPIAARATQDLPAAAGVRLVANLNAEQAPTVVANATPGPLVIDASNPFQFQLTPPGGIDLSGVGGDAKNLEIYLQRTPTGDDSWVMYYVINNTAAGTTTTSGPIPVTAGGTPSVTITNPDSGEPDQLLQFSFSGSAAAGWTIAADFQEDPNDPALVALGVPALPDTTDVPVLTATQPIDPANPDSYNSTTSLNVYDSLGLEHTLSLYFARVDSGNNWQVWASLDGGPPDRLFNGNGADLSFSTTGSPLGGAAGTSFTFPSSGSFDLGPAVDPLSFTVDLSRLTQFGSEFAVTEQAQNGFTEGSLVGISVDRSGTIQGRYSNGRTQALGQVQLQTFTNPNGLVSLGNNLWEATPAAGANQPQPPGVGLNGVISAGVVEDSNVDLTRELVQLIIQQRNYQANAQSIRTQDQLLQTVVNLR